jgi:hypothetical protein
MSSMMTQEFVRSLKSRLMLAVAVAGMMVGVPAGRAQAPAAGAGAAGDAHARGDISGDWQGTLEVGRSLRAVLRVTKGDKGWSGKMFVLLDQGGQPVNISALAFDGSAIKFSIDQLGAAYQGTVSADGTSMVGTLTGGPQPAPQPLTFVRATKETAWEIPAPPPPPKLMSADADPKFEVATIKPNNSGESRMQGLNVSGRNFTTRNSR